MAAMGLAGVGGLAMKALGVSMAVSITLIHSCRKCL